jgi:phosphatidylserine decarboxylase
MKNAAKHAIVIPFCVLVIFTSSHIFAALLNDAGLANRFTGGSAIACLLFPKNYHRFHAPVSGMIAASKDVDGLHYGTKGSMREFYDNHRAYYLIDTQYSGRVAFVAVGMSDINSVNMTIGAGTSVKKGDEIGHFAYGGSGIVMLFEPGIVRMSQPAGRRAMGGISVQMGQKIGTLNPKGFRPARGFAPQGPPPPKVRPSRGFAP